MVDMYETKKKFYNLKATVKRYPEIKTKVKVATNLDQWGPTQQQMQEICDACYHYEDKRLVMRALWKRITNSSTKEWLHIYKALTIFDHLLLHGPEFAIVEEIKEQQYALKTLHDFQAVDERGKDNGLAIREKSRRIIDLVTNASMLAEEREKANKLKARFTAISSDAGGGSSHSGGGGGGGGNDYYSSYSHRSANAKEFSRPATSSDPTGGAGRATPPAEPPSSTPAATSAAESAAGTGTEGAGYVDTAGLEMNEEFIKQQQAILESFENKNKQKTDPSAAFRNLTPPATSPLQSTQQTPPPSQPQAQPKPTQPEFDLFGDAATAPPPQQQTLDSFFGGGSGGGNAMDDLFGPTSTQPPAKQAPAPSRAPPPATDLFANDPFSNNPPQQQRASNRSPPPVQHQVDLFGGKSEQDLFGGGAQPKPTQEEDLFGGAQDPFASQPAQKSGGADDLFGASAFGTTPAQQSAQKTPTQQSQGGGSLWDGMDSTLCNLNNLTVSPNPSPAGKGTASPSLNDLKKQHTTQTQQQQQPSAGWGATTSGADFNPFA
eukprot:TRINITY_DN56528_c0_g2_i1.p1 TRINITY_DN56528_c0_g2~~TRINITY_DN56528_c0_g2_i1.p1  ORF type:complete len:548 (-),score=123.54 TRINITY_DN56528_c0_g2_i1:663-2306(-)